MVVKRSKVTMVEPTEVKHAKCKKVYKCNNIRLGRGKREKGTGVQRKQKTGKMTGGAKSKTQTDKMKTVKGVMQKQKQKRY